MTMIANIRFNVGEELTIGYQGENRRIRVESVHAWGIKGYDRYKGAYRSFRYDRINTVSEAPSSGMPDRDAVTFGSGVVDR